MIFGTTIKKTKLKCSLAMPIQRKKDRTFLFELHFLVGFAHTLVYFKERTKWALSVCAFEMNKLLSCK